MQIILLKKPINSNFNFTFNKSNPNSTDFYQKINCILCVSNLIVNLICIILFLDASLMSVMEYFLIIHGLGITCLEVKK